MQNSRYEAGIYGVSIKEFANKETIGCCRYERVCAKVSSSYATNICYVHATQITLRIFVAADGIILQTGGSELYSIQ